VKISHIECQKNLWSFFYDYTDQSHTLPHPGRIACCSTPNSRPPATKALHTICGNNTSIVLNSWWWAHRCPKHVEQIISAIKHSVASSWFSSLHLYYDARTNIHQIHREVRLCPCAKKKSQYGQTSSQLTICTRSSLLQNLRELIYDGKMFFARCSTLPACQVDQCWTRYWHIRQLKSLTNPSVQTVGTAGNLALICRFFYCLI